MARRNNRTSHRGVSLIEALIAMAVMGFGMLAIVGVQSNLSFNAEMAKQRAEATRLAEQELELVRSFDKVASSDSSEKEYTNIAGRDEVTKLADEFSNTDFKIKRDVIDAPDGLGKMIIVVVKWTDRTGVERQVSMHDLLARVDPMLSGFVKAARPLTALGRRGGRHPTIPGSAVNVPGDDGKSIFLPPNSSGIGWVFDNATGAITYECTGIGGYGDISASTLSSTCTARPENQLGQLVSGHIRFNLRGATYSPSGSAISVMKPAANADAAWVINNTTSKLERICPAPIATPTASLTEADVASGCSTTEALVSPFSPSDLSDLTSADSEEPRWPTLPATVELDTSSATRSGFSIGNFNCYADYQTSTLAHALTTPPRTTINYFCIVKPDDSTKGWGARTAVKPLALTDTYTGGVGATWAIGTTAGTYRVCRYTQALSDFTDNDDHPATYSVESSSCMSTCQLVKGNLINQNFLVIDGTKTCPQESTPVDPAGGNLINSNTRQHQPAP